MHWSTVEASSFGAARGLVVLRGIGEELAPIAAPVRLQPSALFEHAMTRRPACPAWALDMINAVHGAVWLSFLIHASGLGGHDQTLTDDGMLHQVVHWLDTLARGGEAEPLLGAGLGFHLGHFSRPLVFEES